MGKELTAQQKKLAENKAQGMTNLEACKKAGYKPTSDTAASKQWSRMTRNDAFVSYYNSLCQQSSTNAVKSASEIKEGLSRMMDKAEAKGDFSGYTQLANRLCKMEGHDEPEKVALSMLGTVVEKIRSKS